MTTKFTLELANQENGFLCRFGGSNSCSLLVVGYENALPLYGDQRKKVRLTALDKVETLISANYFGIENLEIAGCLFEDFKGLGWRTRFMLKQNELAKTSDISQFVERREESATIGWKTEVNATTLDQFAVCNRCIGVLMTSNNQIDTLKKLNGLIFSQYLFANRISDEFLPKVLGLKAIHGVFCFSGDFDDSWSNLLVFLKKPPHQQCSSQPENNV